MATIICMAGVLRDISESSGFRHSGGDYVAVYDHEVSDAGAFTDAYSDAMDSCGGLQPALATLSVPTVNG